MFIFECNFHVDKVGLFVYLELNIYSKKNNKTEEGLGNTVTTEDNNIILLPSTEDNYILL